ncbi:MAG: hypothetical protein JWN37_459 [Candidatus Nomurabacteria bacterium]|nr:hypothetical protein [Candidatus Nomurabacteria bacterium]
MTTQHISIKDIFTDSWAKYKENAWYLIIVLILAGVVTMICNRVPLLGAIVGIIVSIALTTVALVITNNQTPTYGDLVKNFKDYKITLNYILASILVGLIMVVLWAPIAVLLVLYFLSSLRGETFIPHAVTDLTIGLGSVFILLALFGVYVIVRLQFYKFIVIDIKDIGPIDAIKKSMEITRGRFWKIFGFLILIVLFNIVGIIALGIGLLITVPVSLLAMTYLYRKLHHTYHTQTELS